MKISHVFYLCLVLSKLCAKYLYYFSGYKERFLKLSSNYFTQTFKISFFLTISHNDTIKAILRFTLIYIYIYIDVNNICTFILILPIFVHLYWFYQYLYIYINVTNICTFILLLPIFEHLYWCYQYSYIYIDVTNICTFILILPIFEHLYWCHQYFNSWLWASNGEGLVFESRPYKHKYKSLRICQGPETRV